MNKYFKYGNTGGIGKVMSREINYNSGYYNTLLALMLSEKDSDIGLTIEGFKIIHYAFDDRLKKDVFMLVHDHSGHKEQFVCYFIEEES